MVWWWWTSSQMQSRRLAVRQRAIHRLLEVLESKQPEEQRRAAKLLAAIGHPLAVRWLMRNSTNREWGEWTVAQLGRVLNLFPGSVETQDLRTLADFGPVLQRTDPKTQTNRPTEFRVPKTWLTYRTIDCSEVQRLAKEELRRRGEHSD